MLKTYEHPDYELSGSWNSDNYAMYLWFPVNHLIRGVSTRFEIRKALLIGEMSRFLSKPSVDLFCSDDAATTEDFATIPTDEKCDLEVGTDLVVVEGLFKAISGEKAMDVIGGHIESVFGNQMFARARS